jgi:hypothetical protein
LRRFRSVIALAFVASVLAGVAYAAGIQWGECVTPLGHLESVNGIACNDGGALPVATTQLTSIIGTAQRGGGAAGTQVSADAELSVIQFYLWCDSNGNGVTDAGDVPGTWTLLGSTHTAVGWDGQAVAVDSGTAGELLAAPLNVTLAPNKRYFLLQRVVAAATGYTSLQPTSTEGTPAGPEVWRSTGAGAYGVTASGGLSGIRDRSVWYFKVQAGNVGATPNFPSPPNVIENH